MCTCVRTEVILNGILLGVDIVVSSSSGLVQ